MLEIRYKVDTGEITRTAYSPKLAGGYIEPKEGELIAVLDLFPLEDVEAWLYDEATQTLKANPDYVEPVIRNPLEEIDKLKADITAIKTSLEIK